MTGDIYSRCILNSDELLQVHADECMVKNIAVGWKVAWK